MQQTTNCGLKKPEANEYYNVGDFNYNADVIDAALKGLEDGKADIGPDGKVPAEQLPEIQKITVDDALSGTSTNPVQNKVVKAALDQKAAGNHSHAASGVSYDDTTTGLGAANVQAAVEKLKVGLDGRAKIETGSYVGTGTYGEANPCSLTFEFVPKLVWILGQSHNGGYYLFSESSSYNYRLPCEFLPTTYTAGCGFGSASGTYGKRSEDGKTIYWYTTGSDAALQNNRQNYEYYYVAIG